LVPSLVLQYYSTRNGTLSSWTGGCEGTFWRRPSGCRKIVSVIYNNRHQIRQFFQRQRLNKQSHTLIGMVAPMCQLF
jgi:hypothetical protein